MGVNWRGGGGISRPIVVGGNNFFLAYLFGGAIFFKALFCKLFFYEMTLYVL